MKIDLDKRFFNPLFFILWGFMRDERIRYIHVTGGSSSSKTYSIVQALTLITITEHTNQMVFRKTGIDISDTVYRDFEEVMKRWPDIAGLSFFTINRVNLNKGMIRFRGMDRPERIKGISSYKRLYCNEVSEFDNQDWKELVRRLRGIPGQQIITDCNPISRNHWLKKQVLDREQWTDVEHNLDPNSFVRLNADGDTVWIKTTYRDNAWIVGGDNRGYRDESTLKTFERMRLHDPDDYVVYGLGEWGTLSERAIYRNWEIIDDIPQGAKRIPSGMDFGFSPDPTALTDLYITRIGDTDCVVLDERIYDYGLENVKSPNPLSDSIESRLEAIGFEKSQMIVADSAEPKSIMELRNRGYNVIEAVKGAGSILSGIKLIKGYKILVTRRSTHIINELENYKRKVDRNGVILPEPIDADNHALDGVRYVFLMKNMIWS